MTIGFMGINKTRKRMLSVGVVRIINITAIGYLINLTYSYINCKNFVQTSVIKYSISGLCGFTVSMISLAIVLIDIVFIKLIMEKQTIIAKQ